MKHYLLIALLALLVACKKDNAKGDSQMPVIMLTAPTNNQSFSAGQQVNISASISDNSMIKQVHLEIINTATGAFLAHEHFSPDASTYTLTKTFTAQTNASYKIKVEAEDGSRNGARAEVVVVSQ